MDYINGMTEEQHDAWHELKDIENWFASTDYMVNKIVVGEWEVTDPRWLEYKATRIIKRNRQDELRAFLALNSL
mgnify:CR=1 FL=1